jgi:acyl-CoA thioesterase-1
MHLRWQHALIFLTCVGAIGCSKSEQVDSPERGTRPLPAANGAAKQPDSRPLVVAFGDSLSEGYGVEPGKSFPDQLQQKLARQGYGYRVVNMGISGDTTTGGLARLQAVIDLKPAVVILELGGNDGLRGVPVAATRTNLEAMIQRLQATGIQVLLAGMTLPPNYGPDYISRFEHAYTDLSAEYKVPLIPFLMQDIARELASQPSLMQRDGIHPTAEGHRVIAETVFRYLKPMLKKSS